MRIDLHTHSSASDGTDEPAEVMRQAAGAGLDVVALTDHDTLAGHAAALAALPPGLTLVTGMELSCRSDGHSVHLLAYQIDPGHAELARECQAIVTDRARRARAMVDLLRGLGVAITWEQVETITAGGVPGRPHVARAMVAAGAISAPEQAFTPEWIGAGGRAYVAKYALDPVAAIGLVRAAGGVAVLAHPGVVSGGWRVPAELIARLAAAGLAGLEVAHPSHDHDERQRLASLATDLGLATTGGSDDHGSLTGYRIGQETTPPGQYERLMALAASGPPAPGPATGGAAAQAPPAGDPVRDPAGEAPHTPGGAATSQTPGGAAAPQGQDAAADEPPAGPA